MSGWSSARRAPGGSPDQIPISGLGTPLDLNRTATSAEDLQVMRLVLEWLGVVPPDPARKEPVAVPAWAPIAVAAVIAVTATGLAALLRLAIGASA